MSPHVEIDKGVFDPSEHDPQNMLNDKILQLKEFRESVKLSSEDIQKQLQNIDTKTQFYTTITLIISVIALFSLGQLFGILKTVGIFWIPGSFLLWFLWMIFGIITLKKINDIKKIALKKQDLEIENEKLVKDKMMDWFYKTLYPPIIGLSFLFFITLIFIFSINFGLIETKNQISMEIPIVSSLLFLGFPFFLSCTKPSREKKSNTVSILLLIFAIIVALILVLIFPFLALLNTLQLLPVFPLINTLFFFVIIEIIQVFFILLFTSSVSSYIADIELKNTITSLTRINDEISNLSLNPNEIQEDSIPKLIQQFQTTKKYDIQVFNLLFFKVYSIIPNQVFLRKIKE
jgi:hypothetical protein